MHAASSQSCLFASVCCADEMDMQVTLSSAASARVFCTQLRSLENDCLIGIITTTSQVVGSPSDEASFFSFHFLPSSCAMPPQWAPCLALNYSINRCGYPRLDGSRRNVCFHPSLHVVDIPFLSPLPLVNLSMLCSIAYLWFANLGYSRSRVGSP